MSLRTRTVITLLAFCASLVAAGVALAQITDTGVTLTWTSPGDDSLTGTAARYDLRWSLSPINSLADFDLATPVDSLPPPDVAGSPQTAVVTGLTPETTYWFAIRTFDEVGNGSALSNPFQVTTLASSDAVRPAPVPLSLVGTTNSTVTVGWSDVGDDSLTGVASSVEVRWSTAPITDANWSQATVGYGAPAPGPAGTPHVLLVTDLDRTRDLWFAARARDDVNRYSTVGTPLGVPHLLDTAPPATPAGLRATVPSPPSVHLQWNPNSEPDLSGYLVYRSLDPLGPFAQLTGSPVAVSDYTDGSAPDTVSVWYEVSAVDATGNESARSAPLRVFLRGAGITAWNVSTPYPNPSPVGADVTLPIDVPPSGPYDATVDIQDAAGQHVRTLRVTGAPPGTYALRWDGRNDAGRACAPGVYHAWLHAGDARKLARFVRTP
jgi:hypothetical protein